MQFRLSTLLLGSAVVAASLGLAGAHGIILALYGFSLVWLLRAAQRSKKRHVAAFAVGWMAIGCCGILTWSISEPAWEIRQGLCRVHLKQIGLGLLNYYDAKNSLPPLGLPDERGNALLSWRVLLLPYFCDSPRYKKFSLSQSWDGPHNRVLIADRPWIYSCPEERSAGSSDTETDYLAVTGPGTFWDNSSPKRPGETLPPGARKIAVIEIAHSGIAWTEPRDLALEQALAGVNPPSGSGISSRHESRGAWVCFGDGLAEFLPEGTPPELLKKLLTEGYDDESLEQLRALPHTYRTVGPRRVLHVAVWFVAVLALLLHGLVHDRRAGRPMDQGGDPSAGVASTDPSTP
jgi:hypothetical protein